MSPDHATSPDARPVRAPEDDREQTAGAWFLWKSFIRTAEGDQNITIWQRRPRVFDDLEEEAPVEPYRPTSLPERLKLLWGLVVPPKDAEQERRLLGWALRRPAIAGLGLLLSRDAHGSQWLNHPASPALLWRLRIQLRGRGRFDAEGSIMQRPDAPPAWRHAILGLTPQGVEPEQIARWAQLLVSGAQEHHGITPAEWTQVAKDLPQTPGRAITHVMNGLASAPSPLPREVWDAVQTHLPVWARVDAAAWMRLILRPDVPDGIRQMAQEHLCRIPSHHQQPPTALDRQAQHEHALSMLKALSTHPASTWNDPSSLTRIKPILKHLRRLLHQDPEDLKQLQPLVRWLRDACLQSQRPQDASRPGVLDLIADDPDLLLLLRDAPLALPSNLREMVLQQLQRLPPTAWRPALLSANPARRLLALAGLATIADGPERSSAESSRRRPVSDRTAGDTAPPEKARVSARPLDASASAAEPHGAIAKARQQTVQ